MNNMTKYKRGDDNSNDMNGPSPAFYSCSWFERKANKENVFPEESLKSVTP